MYQREIIYSCLPLSLLDKTTSFKPLIHRLSFTIKRHKKSPHSSPLYGGHRHGYDHRHRRKSPSPQPQITGFAGSGSENGLWTLIIDGSWTSFQQNTGIAWICLNHTNQKFNQTTLVKKSLQTPLVVEAIACLEAIKWAIRNGIKHINIQTDCQVLVCMLNTKGLNIEWRTTTIVEDILSYVKCLYYVCISKVGRDVIKTAHDLAKGALKV
ncbi:uncharacterized protein LOC114298915 [Camellia sinensis]|uniref:uncharacterized protein LOC114298915 n=1 Tax=Camellia sinensis TaxID=4442 RepID=UPI001035C742|nr:uncharacterized protein LOC114298915 [Camellia sinensis]